LDKASELQAYSYIRLCMVPVIQSMTGGQTQAICLSVVCDMVFNLLTLFCGDYGFPFPLSRQVHIDTVLCNRQQQEMYLTSGEMGGSEAVDIEPVDSLARDCQDDVLDMLTALLTARPNFALSFWVSRKLHPFTSLAMECISKDPTLIVPSLRFLAALAGGPGGSTCESTYAYIKNKPQGRFDQTSFRLDWAYLLDLLSQYAQSLSKSGGPGYDNEGYRSISDEDTDVLEAIVDLLGAVMRRGSVTTDLYSRGAEPVKTLFALLACPVRFTLKGSILRALASICSSTSSALPAAASEVALGTVDSVARPTGEASGTSTIHGLVLEEIWSLMEDYRLLPLTSSMTGGHGVNGPAVQNSGLHCELEDVESMFGMYPVTDGFLTLLVALLQHEKGLPVNLGFGSRVPGIVCYIDYVVNEILLKMHLRNYAFEGEGLGQRWKITSQAIMVLVSVLQQYTINTLNVSDILQNGFDGDRQSGASRDKDIVSSALFETPHQRFHNMIADFRNETVDYPLDLEGQQWESTSLPAGRSLIGGAGYAQKRGTVQRFQVPRAKSAGFAVMCHVLHHSRRLLDFLLSLLRENSMESLGDFRNEEITRACWRSVEVMRIAEKQKAAPSQNTDNSSQNQLENADYQLPGFGWDAFRYDIAYWKHRTVSSIIGLIYEVSIREKVFMDMVRSSEPLSILRTERLGSVASLVPVQLCSLDTLLSSSPSHSQPPLISVVASFIVMEPEPAVCFPSVPVLAVRVLHHIAMSQNSMKVLSLIADSAAGDQLVSSCTAALMDGSGGMVHRLFSSSECTVRQGGAIGDPSRCFGLVFTPSASLASDSLTISLRYYFESSQFAHAQSLRVPEGRLEERIEDDVREAVIDLLLLSLHPSRKCISHYLLGLLDLSDTKSVTSYAVRGFNMRPGFPANCLDAVLDLLSLDSPDNASLYARSPIQAAKCYELLYRLLASPVTTSLMRQVMALRKGTRFVHFLQPHLALFLEHQRKLRQHGDSSVDVLHDAARINCRAWVLKIFALELHTMELSSRVPRSAIQALLSILFSTDSAMNFTGLGSTWLEGGIEKTPAEGGMILVLQLLSTMPLTSPFDVEGHDSPLVVQCMRESSVPYCAAYGQPLCHSRNDPPGKFTFVNIHNMMQMMHQEFSQGASQRSDIDAVIDRAAGVAANYNKYNVLMAALANACQGWRQVVDVSLFGCGSLLLGRYIDEDSQQDASLRSSNMRLTELSSLRRADDDWAADAAVSKIVRFLMLPTLRLLVSNPSMEMVLAEQLARSFVSMTALLREICTAQTNAQSSDSVRGATSILSESQHDDLIAGTIQTILRRGSAHAARSTSSTSFRGLLYTSLVQLVRCDTTTAVETNSTDDIYLESNPSHSDEFRARCTVLLEPYASDLVDIIGGDASLPSKDSLICRMSAFSALGCLLSIIGPQEYGSTYSGAPSDSVRSKRHSQYYRDTFLSSSPYVNSITVLRDKGHLKRILCNANLSSSMGEHNSGNISFSSDDILLEATLTLCSHIACSSEGAHLLYDLGVIQFINTWPTIPVPSTQVIGKRDSHGVQSSNSGYLNGRSRHSHHEIPVSEQETVTLLAPFLRLMRAMAASSPSEDILRQCAEFLVHNHQVVSYFLRLQFSTLGGLRLTLAIVSLMCTIASAGTALSERMEGHIGRASSERSISAVHSLWEVCMGPKGDSYTAELCNMAKIIGANPLPAWRRNTYGMHKWQGAEDSWWNFVVPNSPSEHEMKGTVVELPSSIKRGWGGGYRNNSESQIWSQFDAIKFTLGLNILERVSSFLRIRSNLDVVCGISSSRDVHGHSQRGRGNLQLCGILAVDVKDLCESFQSVASFYLSVYKSGSAGTNESSWLTEPSAIANSYSSRMLHSDDDSNSSCSLSEADKEIRRLLLHSVESLMCSVYDIIAMSSSAERASWSSDITACLQVAEDFTPHSFVRQLARDVEMIGNRPNLE